MNKCIGCGAKLQEKNKEEIGFTTNIENNLCERCFRIRNYGEYKTIVKDNNEFIEILKNINTTKDLVILVLDIFNMNKNLDIIKQYIKNDILLVITKRDLLPRSVNDEKLLKYVDKFNIKYIDKIIISSTKNYNFDSLYEHINKYKKSKDVYVIGYTNAGKSTMINKLIYNYSENDSTITTSILPSTTLNEIKIGINENLNIIDTPGILEEESLYNLLDGKELKRIIPKKEIKPINYQIKTKQWIIIDKYAIIEAEKIDLVLFVSNTLKIERTFKKPNTQLSKEHLHINNNDLVINGLGFIKFIGEGDIEVYLNNTNIYIRDNLI